MVASQPEFEKLAVWARKGCRAHCAAFGAVVIARRRRVRFPIPTTRPERGGHWLGQSILLPTVRRLRVDAVSRALWSGDEAVLDEAVQLTVASPGAAERGARRWVGPAVEARALFRCAMFYYEGEWYWGVDRLSHLERRLRALGACKTPDQTSYCAPSRDRPYRGSTRAALTLDFYPSLNSPYTSIIFDRTIALEGGLRDRVPPQAGAPDDHAGPAGDPDRRRSTSCSIRNAKPTPLAFPFGNLIFPIGTPTRRAYSLLPWAKAQGKDEELLSSLLKHARGRWA